MSKNKTPGLIEDKDLEQTAGGATSSLTEIVYTVDQASGALPAVQKVSEPTDTSSSLTRQVSIVQDL